MRFIRAGAWIAFTGTLGLLVVGAFQVYLVVLAATTADLPELILMKNRVELPYLLAVFSAMTGLVLGFVLLAIGLARARLISPWAALVLAVSSLAVALGSLYAVVPAAVSLGWLAVELARRATPLASA